MHEIEREGKDLRIEALCDGTSSRAQQGDDENVDHGWWFLTSKRTWKMSMSDWICTTISLRFCFIPRIPRPTHS